MLDSKGSKVDVERDIQGELGVGVAEDGRGPATEPSLGLVTRWVITGLWAGVAYATARPATFFYSVGGWVGGQLAVYIAARTLSTSNII